MMALLRHELRTALWSPSGLLLVGVWLLFVGGFFASELVAFEQAEQRALALDDAAVLAMLDVNDLLLAAVLNNLVIVLLFLGPLLAMRQWSDGPARLWLLQRAPSLRAFVVARLGGQVVTVAVLVGLTLALPSTLAVLGQPATAAGNDVIDVAQTLVGTLVVVAAGASFSLLSAVVIAAVDQPLGGALVAFVVLVALWLVPSATPFVGPTLGSIVAALSPASHLERALRGVVHLGDVAYWLCLLLGCGVAVGGCVAGRRA